MVASTTEVDDQGNGNAFHYYVPAAVFNSGKRGAVNAWLKRDLGVVVADGTLPNDPAAYSGACPYETDGLKSSRSRSPNGRPGGGSPGTLGGDTPGSTIYGEPPRRARLLLRRSPREDEAGLFQRQDRRDRRHRVGAPGRAPDLDLGRRRDVGPRDPGDGDRHRARGLPAPGLAAGLDVALIVLLGLRARGGRASGFGVPRRWRSRSAIGAAYAVVVQLAFNSGTILPFVYPDRRRSSLSAVGALGVHYVTEAFERERTRDCSPASCRSRSSARCSSRPRGCASAGSAGRRR